MGGPEGLMPFVDGEDDVVSATAAAVQPSYESWVPEEMARLGSSLARMVYEVDLMIAVLRELLSAVQPYQAGKIDVRWWRHKSKPGRAPSPFRWKKSARGWTAERLPESRLSVRGLRKGRFFRTAELLREVLGEVQFLIERREELLSAMGIAKRGLSQRVSKSQGWVEESMGRIDKLKARIEKDPDVQKLAGKRRTSPT